METSERGDSFRLLGALTGVVVALLLVGVVSHTPMRHSIQVTPAAIAAVAVALGSRAARYAALPIFVIWLLLMSLIWLYLLGISTFFSGTFTPAEIVLTIVIGLSCLWGIITVRRQPRARPLAAIVFFVLFAALQLAGLWMSFQPRFARR